MIYLKLGGGKRNGENETRLLILEPANIERIKQGLPACSPDKSVFVAYTADSAWLTDEILKLGDDLSAERLTALIEESQKRPDVMTRPHHPHIDLLAQGVKA